MQSSLPEHDIVLLGVGHTNAHVLRMWKMGPIPGARLTCVSNYPVATYSGMLPGTLAGLYPPERMEIDLVRLCAAAGARLIYLPPYSPDLNPIEMAFSKIKQLIRGTRPQGWREIIQAAKQALLRLNTTDLENAFAHCGYAAT